MLSDLNLKTANFLALNKLCESVDSLNLNNFYANERDSITGDYYERFL